MEEGIRSRPNSIPWPPLILSLAALWALMLEAIVPTAVPLAPPLGWLAIAAAIVLDVWAMTTMVAARTNILPNRPAERLVTSGPFAFSRNPIYVGNMLLLVGGGIAFGSWWLVIAAPVAGFAMHRLAVLREERHLEARFGPAWRAYRDRVPRWVGLPRGGGS